MVSQVTVCPPLMLKREGLIPVHYLGLGLCLLIHSVLGIAGLGFAIGLFFFA